MRQNVFRRATAGTGAGDTLCVSRATAVVRALAANPQLLIAGAQAQQARARKVQGVALPDPTFAAEWDNSPAPFGIGGGNGRILGASITVPFFDKFRLNGRIGSAGIHQSEFDSAAVRQAIASQTLQTYDSLLASLRHQANLHQADSLARDFATKTRARFDAGTVARLDVVNADVAVGQVGNQLIANERDIANARASLNRLLGRALGAADCDRRFTVCAATASGSRGPRSGGAAQPARTRVTAEPAQWRPRYDTARPGVLVSRSLDRRRPRTIWLTRRQDT